MKRLLIMGDYFYPDVASTGQILTELCLELQSRFEITVLTSVPSFNMEAYPDRINYEKLKDIRIVRVKTKPFDKANKVSRIKHILEHFYLIRKGIRLLDKQDLVFTISQPPILGGLLGLYARRKHGARLVYNIQDFNPEQAQAVGYFKLKLIYRVLKYIDTHTCRKADKIVIVGKDMVETLENRGIKGNEKITMINNWIDEAAVFPVEDGNVEAFKDKYQLTGKKILMYSGNIGLYYDLENLIEVIGKFGDRQDVIFAFIGDGARKAQIENRAQNLGLQNVRFIPYQEKELLNYSLNAADVHFVVNSKGIKGVSVPSKVYGVMAVGKYVFGILEQGCEAADLIEQSGCGIVIEPGDYQGIFEKIREVLETDKETLWQTGLRGRKYLEQHLRKSQSVEKYRQVFEALTGGN